MRRKISQRMLSASMAAVLAFGMVPMAPSAALAQDGIEGHWGQAALEEWMDYGVIKGYDDGRIAPDDFVNRAQMVAFLDRTMGYQETVENVYPDVADGAWYEDVVLRGAAAGVIKGDADTGMMRPEDSMTRQEAAAVIARVVGLDGSDSPDAGFKDQGEVDEWAEDAVNAMAEKGYVNGHDGYFRPDDLVTRAEAIAMLDNVFGDLCQEAGEYSSDVEGSLVISADGASLKDMVVKGDLIVAEGVGDGHVELDNVTVEGRLIVRGGGANSVVVKGASKIGQVIVDRAAGAVRIAVQGAAEVAGVVVSEAAEGVRLEGNVGSLTVEGAASVVEVAGSVDSVEVAETAADARVVILEGAEAETVKSDAKTATIVIEGTVASLAVSGNASGITVSGAVGAIDVSGDDVVVKVEESATVEKVTTSASGTKVEGEGDVESVVAGEGSSDATVSTEGTKVENNGSGDVAIEGGAVAPGESETTPGGSTSGGGGGVVVPHVHNYVDGVCAADGAYDPSWAQVDSAEDWNAAVEAGVNIVLTADFEAEAQLKVSKAVTINGNGRTVNAGSWADDSPSSKGEAPLVSVVAGNSAIIIKNITLRGAKTIDSTSIAGGTKDYGHGLNVYESSNVVLENVVLSNNAGAGMVVNSSTVKAVGLKTRDNGWGGVNIDNMTNLASSFAFDGTSNFDDVVAVYSDKGGVTVSAPEGWAACEASGKTVWTKLFDGGYGTEEAPYEIATADQLQAINALGSQMSQGASYHFILTDDIDYSAEAQYISYFSGVLDGQGHRLLMSDSSGEALIAETRGDVSIKNLTVVQKAETLAMLTVFANADKGDEIVYENIKFASGLGENFVHKMGSYGSSQFGMQASGKVSYINCVNEVSYNVPAGQGDYSGIFVGNYIKAGVPSMISFVDCVNRGTVSASQLGFFFGNSAQASGGVTLVDNRNYENTNENKAAIYVSGCRNEGVMLATLKCQPFLSLNASTVNDDVNEQLKQKGKDVFFAGAMSLSAVTDMGLRASDGQLKITPSSLSANQISTYSLTYSVSTTYKDAEGNSMGSWYFSVVEVIPSNEIEGKEFDYVTKVMLDTQYDQTAESNKKYSDLAIGESVKHDQYGNEYIIVSLGDGTKAAVINSEQAAANYDGAASVSCGNTPVYSLTVQNNLGQSIGAIKYTAGSIPSV